MHKLDTISERSKKQGLLLDRQTDRHTHRQYENITFPHTRAVLICVFFVLFLCIFILCVYLFLYFVSLEILTIQTPPPPTGPNSSIVGYIFAEKHTRRRSISPPPHSPKREILDPPLILYILLLIQK